MITAALLRRPRPPRPPASSRAGTVIWPPETPRRMGGWGRCPCCKAGKDLTEHHDKDVGKKFLLCRECHDVVEAYIRLVDGYRDSAEKE